MKIKLIDSPMRISFFKPILLAVLGSLSLQAGETKKLIEFGWDEPDPAFMRQHVSEMEKTPFDGCVFHVNYPKNDGTSGNFTWECWGTRTFTEAELKPALDDLRATPFQRLTHNFLRFNVTPGNVDWFDDFSAILENARLAARVARDGKCKGILFDIEHYAAPLFKYRAQRDAGKKSWELYAAQARLRGREVMQSFEKGYPGVTLFLTFGYSLPWANSESGKTSLLDCDYGLLAPFLDGMMEVISQPKQIVDGCELAYPFRELEQFPAHYKKMKEELLPIVADPKKYKEAVSLGFGLWMDYDWRNRGWKPEEPEKNFYTPEKFEASVRTALATADEYVWIYTEKPRWWTEDGGAVELPEAYVEAVRRAKEAASKK